jgi:hypothetical protein
VNDWHVASRRSSSPRCAVKQNDRRDKLGCIGIQTGWYSGGGECAVAYCYENVAQKVAKEYGNGRGWNSVCT